MVFHAGIRRFLTRLPGTRTSRFRFQEDEPTKAAVPKNPETPEPSRAFIRRKGRALFALLGFAVLAVFSLILSLVSGSLPVGLADFATLLNGTPSMAAEVVWQLRLPRALAGFACGGLLALSGALMQTLLRNPLADPYILGVSGGAGVGALLAIFLGLSGLILDSFAFLGALCALFLVFGLARGDHSWTQTRLLLTGVIVASACGALITLLLALASEGRVRGMLFWLMGDLSQTVAPWGTLAVLGFALVLTLPFARELNLLAKSQETAQTLGVSVSRLRGLVYFVAAFSTAASVVSAGTIGFVGLVVPHLTRLLTGSDMRLLLPASALFGGALLMAADTLSRTLIAPEQLPVGVLTALIGAPLFLFLLARSARPPR